MKRGTPSLPLCPRCGNLSLHALGKFDGWIFPIQYRCAKCGYIGNVTIEIDLPDKKGDL
ncbi:hypothetical protein [[Eubacterium] cellulosolvens]